MKVGIMGLGGISHYMARALNGLSKEGVIGYAAASRSIEKAEAFISEHGFEKAYGTYEELAKDPDVDLIYIATPHAQHYENAKLCLENGKNVLVEKAFTANSRQAQELVDLAHRKNLLLTEAIWTRYMPARKMVDALIAEGKIGTPTAIEAEFSAPICHVERMYKPELAGGALLDLGVYTITFASMFFGYDIKNITSTCEKYHTGVDGNDEILFTYQNGKTAKLSTCMVGKNRNEGIIFGTKGFLKIDNLNNFRKIEWFDEEGTLVDTYYPPEQINGYEYEVLSCKKALEDGHIECLEMTHWETVEVMKWMDELRINQWGIIYPFE